MYMYLVSATSISIQLIGFKKKNYTVVVHIVHYLQMCMREYGCWPKFERGDNSTCTFTKKEFGGILRPNKENICGYGHLSKNIRVLRSENYFMLKKNFFPNFPFADGFLFLPTTTSIEIYENFFKDVEASDQER